VKHSAAATKIQTSCELTPSSFKLPKHILKQILLHCSFTGLLVFHSIITLCLKFTLTLLVSSGVRKP